MSVAESRLALSTLELERKLRLFEQAPSDEQEKPEDLVAQLKATGDFYRATNLLIPAHIRYWSRFARKKALQKRRCAEFAYRSFIRSGFRGFVQASTTTMYLGSEMARACPANVLIYTNSVVLPLTALRENASHRIYTFCGSLFDEFCGGWLPPVDDTDAHTRLRSLFEGSSDDRLTTAILAPMALKPDSGPFFVRQEMSILASIILEAAEKVIMLVPADRLFPNDKSLDTAAPLFRSVLNSLTWRELSGKVHVVVAGRPRDESISRRELEHAFVAAGTQIDWEDPDTLQWPREMQASAEVSAPTIEPLDAETQALLSSCFPTSSERDMATELCRFAIASPYDFTDWLFTLGKSIANQHENLVARATVVMELLEKAMTIGQILSAFRANPAATTDQIAEQFGWSRTTLHANSCGLAVRHFRTAGATVPWLVTRSKKLLEDTFNVWKMFRTASSHDGPEFPFDQGRR